MKLSKARVESDGNYNTKLYLDGKEITNYVTHIILDVDSESTPQLTVTYSCYDQLTFEGKVEVHHVCPAIARRKPYSDPGGVPV